MPKSTSAAMEWIEEPKSQEVRESLKVNPPTTSRFEGGIFRGNVLGVLGCFRVGTVRM